LLLGAVDPCAIVANRGRKLSTGLVKMVAGWRQLGQNAPVGRIRAFAAFATALVAMLGAACTSSPTGPGRASSDPVSTSGSPPTPTPSVSGPAPSSTPPPMTISNPGPPHATQPTLPPDVPTTGPNTRPGEKPPAMPLEATQHTARGARAFAAFFIKTIDWGYATTSSAYMRHYFNRRCVACSGFATSIDRVAHEHERYVGGRFAVKSVSLIHSPVVKTADDTCLVHAAIGQYRIVRSNGTTMKRGNQLTGERFEVSIARSKSGWVVVQLGVVL
jgi:hypothetical protein